MMAWKGRMVHGRFHRSTLWNNVVVFIFIGLFVGEKIDAFSFLENTKPSVTKNVNRRAILTTIPSSIVMIGTQKAFAEDEVNVDLLPVQVAPPSDVRSLFNEARVYESQVR